jgi:NAD+ synthase
MLNSTLETDLLKLDVATETDRITEFIRDTVVKRFKRKGLVIGVSGGIDSSVVAALAQRALGSERVLLLLMPEAESSAESLALGKKLADNLGVEYLVNDITPILQAAGCYRQRDEAIKAAFPGYQQGFKSKIVLPNQIETDSYALFSLVVQTTSGEITKVRLPLQPYLGIVAATNFKQRVRKMIEYYHADRLNFAVAGTPNRLEYDLGFFVKNGDGSADIKPIAHLYKSQVYQLADYLGVPEEIRRRPPTTDTYSLEQSQEEFYFSLPLQLLDLCIYGKDNGIPANELALTIGLEPEKVGRIYATIDSKRKAARYLRAAPAVLTPTDKDSSTD